jgi:hypothetical protein
MVQRHTFTHMVLLAVLAGGCRSSGDGEGAAPPPVPSARPNACAGGGGTVADPVAGGFFESRVGAYCIDPNSDSRTYGENARGSLDDVCTQQFDGECEIYKRYGLRRVVMARYIDGEGSPGTVSVTLSRFDSREGALGFYTKRVVADGDPVRVAPAPLEAGGAGALGTGIAYVWKGEHVAELSYSNEIEPPDAIKQSSLRVLPPIAQRLGERLPGSAELPPDARLLPAEERVPQGLRYETDDVLGVAGVGGGAIGYYASGDRRYRQFALIRPDEDSAKDVVRTLEKLPRAKSTDDRDPRVVTVPLQQDGGAVTVEWLVARSGARVFGVGDEELVLQAEQSTADRERVLLTREQKLGKLRALVAGSR